jgi:predicted nucleic acid-binding Zn ribbon protein
MSRTKNSRKNTGHPPSWFKRLERQARRAQAKMAVRMGKDPVEYQRCDRYNWT